MFSTPKRRAAAWFVIGVLATGLLMLSLYTLFSMGKTTDAIRSTQLDSRKTSERIEDCTSPDGECFKRGQAQTASAVASINRVAIIAAACADKPRRQTVEAIQSCVIAELARQSVESAKQ